MNEKERRAAEEALRKTLELIEATKSEEGNIDLDAASEIEGVDFSDLETDEARIKAISDLYDKHDELVREIEAAEEAKKALKDRKLASLKAVDAPAIHTSKTSGSEEFDLAKSIEGLKRGGDPVPLPADLFINRKAEFRTIGGTSITREKAALNFPARWAVQDNIVQLANQPTVFDYLRTFTTDAGSWPIRQATAASNVTPAVQASPGTALTEVAPAAAIQDNNLYAVGAWFPVTRQQMRVPGAMQWSSESAAVEMRASVDSHVVGGTGHINGFGDRSFPADNSRSVEVAVASSTNAYGVVDGLIDASAKSASARGGLYPDFAILSHTQISRLQKEMREYRISPENRVGMIQNMVVIPSNHLPANKAFVANSTDIATVLHSDGFQMEIGLQNTDFIQLQETLRAFVEMQVIFEREQSVVQLTFATS